MNDLTGSNRPEMHSGSQIILPGHEPHPIGFPSDVPRDLIDLM